jgi:hypothetical protein
MQALQAQPQMPPPVPHKRCSKCGQEKSLESFQANKKKRDGKQDQCKLCRKRTGVNERHEESLVLGRALLELTAKHPDFSDILHEAIGSVRMRGKRTTDRDLETIKQLFREYPCLTVEDICEDTRLPEHDVEAILEGMVTTRMIEGRQRPRPDVSRGAFEMVYHWIGQKPLSSMVLP